MPLMKGFDTAASGMSAERIRLDTVSSNLANAETTHTAEGGPYQRKIPIFEALPGMDGESGGVAVKQIATDTTPGPRVYDPGHADAKPDGYVDMPNVNVVEEMVDMMSASRSFEANSQSFQSLRDMVTQALQLGRS